MRLIVILFLLISYSDTYACNGTNPWVDTQFCSSLEQANNEASSRGAEIWLTSSMTLSSSISFTVPVRDMGGAIISSGDTVYVTLRKFFGSLKKVFNNFGSRVKFESGAVSEIFSEWWGGSGNGASVDSYPAITSALASLPNNRGTVKLGIGDYYISQPIILDSYKGIEGSGIGSTRIFVGSSKGIVTASGSQQNVIKNLSLSDYQGNSYTGIELYNNQDSDIKNITLYHPYIGILLKEATYFSDISGLYMYGVNFKGIGSEYTTYVPSNNTIHFKHIQGLGKDVVPNSVGIEVEGVANSFYGGEVDKFNDAITIGTHAINNNFTGIYEELCNYGVNANNTYGVNYFDSHIVDYPRGLVFTRGSSSVGDIESTTATWNNLLPQYGATTEDLSALYLFTEGTGTTLNDSSGKSHHAYLSSTGTWTSSPYGYSLNLNSDNSEIVVIPPDVIDISKPFTIGIYLSPHSASSGTWYNARIFNITDGINPSYYLRMKTDIYGGNFASYVSVQEYMGVSVISKSISYLIKNNKWGWIFLSYDPVNGALSNLNPIVYNGAQINMTLENPLTAIGGITIHGPNVSGKTYSINYGAIAIWKRKLVYPEVRRFVDNIQNTVWENRN